MTDLVLPVAAGIIDSEAMFAATADLPDQLAAAVTNAKATAELLRPEEVRGVVVLGMGGSGVAGEILRAVGGPSCAVPIICVDGYDLPGFVGSDTLVFAVSFSGATEETLSGANQALARGARLVAVSGGGALSALADANGATCFGIAPGIPEPRAGLGATLAPLLIACESLGLLSGMAEAIEDAIAQLRARRIELVVSGGGLAGEIAQVIGRSFPLVYGAAGIGAVAARRWKTQVNENAKAPAFAGVQPEICHNEICGFGQSGDVTRQVVTLCFLRSDHDHPRVDARFSLFAEAVREAVSDIVEVRAKGEGPLAQLLDLIFIGDFVSLHLAAREGIDPGPVPVLVDLKRHLATWQG